MRQVEMEEDALDGGGQGDERDDPLSEMDALASRSWRARVRKAAQGEQVLLSRAASVLSLLKAAHRDPVRRSGEGMPFRIRHAAERRRLLEAQKADLRSELMRRYSERDEAMFLDSIPGSNPFYNALTLALIGDDFRARFHTLIHRTTKPKLATQEAYVAVMNSYLRIAHSLVTRRELYVPLAERLSTIET